MILGGVWNAHPLKSFFQHRLPRPWNHFGNHWPPPWNHFSRSSGTWKSFLKHDFVCHELLPTKFSQGPWNHFKQKMKWFQGAGTPKLLLVKTLSFWGLAFINFEGLEVFKWNMRPKWFWNSRIYVNGPKTMILRNDFRIPTPPKKIIYQGRGDTNIYIYIYSENMEYSTTWHWTLTLLPTNLKHRNRVPWGVEEAS